MKKATAHLRISYIGGGYDFPEFFAHQEVRILSEGLPLSIECHRRRETIHYKLTRNVAPLRDGTAKSLVRSHPDSTGFPPHSLKSLRSGLGSSAARHLSWIRAKFPHAPFREQVAAAIHLDALQAGGWQDAIASAYSGMIKIVLHQNDWRVYPLRDMNLAIHPYRRLYSIPTSKAPKQILTEMRCRESSFQSMQKLVADGENALLKWDLEAFGSAVTAGWILKKSWHPEISNNTITKMEETAADAGAWGWKVCGAGGQGFFLVIGDKACHQQMSEKFTEFEVV